MLSESVPFWSCLRVLAPISMSSSLDSVTKLMAYLAWALLALALLNPVLGAKHGTWSYEKGLNLQGSEDLVTDLPGQPSVGFRHYAGYVTVNEKNGRALFYWFYEALDRCIEKPLVLWLNGGPGCSSVGYGATQEIGPFIVDTHGHGLKFNPYSWNKGIKITGHVFISAYISASPSFPDYLYGLHKTHTCCLLQHPTISRVAPTIPVFIFDNRKDMAIDRGWKRSYVADPNKWKAYIANTKDDYIEANIIFLESPVGVGFSYSNTSSDYDVLGDAFTANDTYIFLHNWFAKFPLYINHTFYIAGESYAGKYVPELAELIYDRNKDYSLYINLRGFMLGNPETSDGEDWRGIVDYAWSHAVVSDETHKVIGQTCDFDSNDTWSNEDCSHAVDELLSQYKEIDIYSLYTSVCTNKSVSSEDKSLQVMFRTSSKMMPRIMGGYDPCLDDYAHTFYNRADVQKALHVSNGRHIKDWRICNDTIFRQWLDSKPSVIPIYKKLIAAGLRIWIYSGDTDGRVPVLSTRYSLSALKLPIIRAWRPWYHQKEVSGWLQEYDGLTFATFRGAGHAVPIFKPSNSLAFFASFLAGESPSSVR